MAVSSAPEQPDSSVSEINVSFIFSPVFEKGVYRVLEYQFLVTIVYYTFASTDSTLELSNLFSEMLRSVTAKFLNDSN